MSYDLHMYRRRPGKGFEESMDLLEQIEIGEKVPDEVLSAMRLDKGRLANEMLASALPLEKFGDSDSGGDIELNNREGSLPDIQFLFSDYSIGVSIPYWEQDAAQKQALEGAWRIMADFASRNGLVLYDSQIDAEASAESFAESGPSFEFAEKALREFSNQQQKRPWWKFW